MTTPPTPPPAAPGLTPAEAAESAHLFMFNLHSLLNAGSSEAEVWNYCITHTAAAKRALAIALNHYQQRTGQHELSTR